MSYKDDEDIKRVRGVKQENEMLDDGFSNQEAADKLAEYVEERKLVDELDLIDKNNEYTINQKRKANYRVPLSWVKPRVVKEDVEIYEDTRCTDDLLEDDEELKDD